jgi:xanthine dehydrogenase small subunit
MHHCVQRAAHSESAEGRPATGLNEPMQNRPIRFFHRGAIVEVNAAAPTRSVLDWLREDAHCTGTKEGCNEGDCGACTVVVGELAAPGAPGAIDGLVLRSVNACIQFVPTLDGKALFTVEDLKRIAAASAPPGPADPRPLHPVQQAMVDCHGSQCGFCTPGFVMSLWACYEQAGASGQRPTRQQLADELSGNLCRCTGYRPILDAGQRMFELPPVRLGAAPVVAALRELQRDAALDYRPAVGARDDHPAVAARASEAGHRGARFIAPRSVDELARVREEFASATLLAGCTDVGLWVNKQFRELGDIIYLGQVEQLRHIESRADGLHIGAGASLEAAWRALAHAWPTLTEVWLRFASPPIRNAGTMGGNLANGSPIGDSAPVLLALDAQLELRQGARTRRMGLAEFYVGYMKNRLESGEFIQSLIVPPLPATRQVRAYKISKRFDCDISALCAGFAIELDGDTVTQVRLAYGGMAAVVKRAAHAEAALAGQRWDEAALTRAQAALARDFTPLTDMRASAGYRMQVAQNLLMRFWLETRTIAPLHGAATSVWSGMPHDLGLQGA